MLDERGEVRRVLGTLPLTADGCVIGVGYDEPLWREPVCGEIERRWASVAIDNIDPEYRWYSTPQAAEAARGGGA
jgi:hypothetical protein